MASPGSPVVVLRDTRAWQVQVWVSFGLALSLCAIGLAWLPGQTLDRAFMFMAYVFSLSSVFVLARAVRDAAQRRPLGEGDGVLWRLVVWGGFAAAMGLSAWALMRMEVSPPYKAFLGVSWLFMVSSAFTLAKTLRDHEEANRLEARQGRAHDEAWFQTASEA